jgi:hypothetical protein
MCFVQSMARGEDWIPVNNPSDHPSNAPSTFNPMRGGNSQVSTVRMMMMRRRRRKRRRRRGGCYGLTRRRRGRWW